MLMTRVLILIRLHWVSSNMKFTIGDCELYYDITDYDSLDDGRTILFYVPGGPGLSSAHYRDILKPLEEAFHIVYHDPRGCGESDEFAENSYTMANNIADLEALRQHLGMNDVYMLGFSYGSMIALGYATKYAAHIKQLILMAGAVSARFIDLAKRNVATRGTSEQQEICDRLLWPGTFAKQEEILKFFTVTRSLYSRRATQQTAAPKTPMPACAFGPLNLAFQRHFDNFDYTGKLDQVICPTAVFWGKHDWINDVSAAETLRSSLPNATVTIYEESGHSMFADVPELLFPAIKKLADPPFPLLSGSR